MSIVEDWGPRYTTVGSPVNLQPDGSSAIWVRLRQSAASDFQLVKFDELLWRPAVPSEINLVTTVVPHCIIQRPGRYRISLQSSTGVLSSVGIFLVKRKDDGTGVGAMIIRGLRFAGIQ